MKPANELGLDFDHPCDISNFPQKAKKMQSIKSYSYKYFRITGGSNLFTTAFHPKSTYTISNESHVDAIFSKVSTSNFMSITQI